MILTSVRQMPELHLCLHWELGASNVQTCLNNPEYTAMDRQQTVDPPSSEVGMLDLNSYQVHISAFQGIK